MYKIEFWYWRKRDNKWIKGRHKLYDSEKAFEKYWKYHTQGYLNWGDGFRLIGFKDGIQIR